jgi:hypothetical protein
MNISFVRNFYLLDFHLLRKNKMRDIYIIFQIQISILKALYFPKRIDNSDYVVKAEYYQMTNLSYNMLRSQLETKRRSFLVVTNWNDTLKIRHYISDFSYFDVSKMLQSLMNTFWNQEIYFQNCILISS